MKISAVVLTKNEKINIKKCLDSLKFCNEIIVIDDYSNDNTVKIAKSRRVRVFKHHLKNNFATQRNFALQKTKHNWVLFIDADEIVTPPLSQEIVRRLKKTQYNGFYIPRQEVFINQPLTCSDKPSWDWSHGKFKLIRLADKTKGEWENKVHEVWKINGKIGNLKNPIYHYSFPNITRALKKINLYSSIQANDNFQNKQKINLVEIITYPLSKFFKNYFWHQGIKDGTAGMVYCLLMSLQSFLTKAKAWHSQQTKENKLR